MSQSRKVLTALRNKASHSAYLVPWSRPEIGQTEIHEVLKVMKSGWVSQGHVTEEFERALGKHCKARYATAVNNGTSALLCALLAHRAKPGDRVIVPDYTHVATANVPKLLGCKIYFVDIDPDTFNMDYDYLETVAKSCRPKFVIFVDVAGLPNDFEVLSELSKKYGFTLIEDAAESLGAEYNGRKVGSLGCTTVVSFHAAKQVTTIEGGAVLTEEPEIARRCLLIRNHGGAGQTYISQSVGMNLRTTDIQSALGLAQLKKLGGNISLRNRIVNIYREQLSDLFKYQEIPKYASRHAHMMFVAVSGSNQFRNGLRKHLEKRKIETRVPWPPLHRQEAFRRADNRFPHSTDLYEKSISLPLYNAMRNEEAERVVREVLGFKRQGRL